MSRDQSSHIYSNCIFLFKRSQNLKMHRQTPFENHIYSIAIPDRNYDEGQIQDSQERNMPREGLAWFIPNSPPLPNDSDNYRRYRHGLDREQEIEMMLMDHQRQTRSGQRRARVVPQPPKVINERSRVRIQIRNPEASVPFNNGIEFPRWSLFQVWNNLAYVTCSVPFRVAWEDQGRRRYILKYSRAQQMLYGFQQIFSTIEMISWWPQFTRAVVYHPGPLKYVQFGYFALRVLARVGYIKTTFGMRDLLQVHTYALNSRIETGYLIKMGQIMTFVAGFSYSIYLFGYAALDLALYTFRDQKGWDWGLAEFIQTFACYARQVFTWATEYDCPDDIFLSMKLLPTTEIIYGCFGITVFVSGILAQIHAVLLIMSSSLTLLSASHKLTKNTDIQDVPDHCAVGIGHENQQTPRPIATRYEFLEQFSGKISSFVGLIFLLALGVMGISIPNILDEIFNQYRLSVVVAIPPVVIMIISCVGACVSALQIDTLEGNLTEADNVEQLPNDIRRLIIYLHRLFKRSAGIGYRGLFVMNFAYLATYCGAVASLVVFTYETKKP